MQAQLFLSRPGCAMPMAVVMNHQEAQGATDKGCGFHPHHGGHILMEAKW